MISRLSLAAVAALVAAPAFAGGFAPVVETPPPVTPIVTTPPAAPVSADWSGFYVGGQLGYGSVELDDSGAAGLDDVEGDGATYGLHAGYMHDFGRFVLGGEVDFDGSQITVGDATVDEIADVDSVIRAKLRAGFDAGRFLPYVTAGVAQARLSSDIAAVDAALDDSYNGNFYGLGVAYQLNDRFVVGAEALRHNFDDLPIADVDTEVNTVSLRGSFRF